MAPAHLTRYLQISVFALHDFSSWPSVATAALSVASAGGRHPGKVMHPSGHLERTCIPKVVWLSASPCCSWRTEKTSVECIVCPVRSQAMPASAGWRVCNSLIPRERRCRAAQMGLFLEGEATLCQAQGQELDRYFGSFNFF